MSHHDPHQQFGFRFSFTTLVALMMLNAFFKKADLDLYLNQTRTQSLFMCFGGFRRLGVNRLRCARGLMGKDEANKSDRYFSFVPSHETPRAPQPIYPQFSLAPKTRK